VRRLRRALIVLVATAREMVVQEPFKYKARRVPGKRRVGAGGAGGGEEAGGEEQRKAARVSACTGH